MYDINLVGEPIKMGQNFVGNEFIVLRRRETCALANSRLTENIILLRAEKEGGSYISKFNFNVVIVHTHPMSCKCAPSSLSHLNKMRMQKITPPASFL